MSNYNTMHLYNSDLPYKLHKCNLCDFNTLYKAEFQLHLIKTHGFKVRSLEEGEPSKINSYGFGDKFKRKPQERNEAGEYECPNGCGEAFVRLRRLDYHLERCSKGRMSCQLCSFKTENMNQLQMHFIEQHNLLCEPVDEPDFEQVLNNTPYILKRIRVYDELPEKEKSSSRRRNEQLFPCMRKMSSNAPKPGPSCTLCTYKSSNEPDFNRHLLRAHRLVLKSAKHTIDYNLRNKMPREQTPHKFTCKRCEKTFPVAHRLRDHNIVCKQKFNTIVMERLKNGQLTCLFCSDCFNSKEQLDYHLETCSKPQVIRCQLCPFECPVSQMTNLQTHIWNKHNLICKPVREADFLQAVNCTPYTLERVPVLDALPAMSQADAKKLLKCWKCQMSFPTAELLAKHSKLKKCNVD
ncbi:unnamed protein product [Ceutorhynchus assimilis]|uniref:C2H2-type domain-containing protein n=1 Tax=Ceutorhynchus assimilis TaxID=467358 RepID=A0A9N9QHL6_9CUCU|nr:unnamed protein product [Ceutorhynchus assimilis]